MKKSKLVQLVLVAGVLSSCAAREDYTYGGRLHIRGDTVSQYTTMPRYYSNGGFYPFYHHTYFYHPFMFHRRFSSSDASGHASKSVSRGGFGRSGHGKSGS